MDLASRDFQIFVKPAGSLCNLNCVYCYYLKKKHLYSQDVSFRMSENILEEYIKQHLRVYPDPKVRFSWHGGEPTILELDYFHRIVKLQKKHQSPQQNILNGIQTNGILLNEEWCRFFASEDFSVGLSLDGPQEQHDSFRLTKDLRPTHKKAMRAYELIRKHNISFDILCVVNAENVQSPIQIYRFFKQIDAPYVSFLPIVEHNGDFFSCDHFVDQAHRVGNIMETPLVKLLESPKQREFGLAKLDSLPRYCRECEVRPMCHGECPKNRFLLTPDGEEGLNYLCKGYKRFFNHCRPFVSQVAAQWKKQDLVKS